MCYTAVKTAGQSKEGQEQNHRPTLSGTLINKAVNSPVMADQKALNHGT